MTSLLTAKQHTPQRAWQFGNTTMFDFVRPVVDIDNTNIACVDIDAIAGKRGHRLIFGRLNKEMLM